MFLSTKKLWMGMALVASLGYSCQHDESLGVEAITGFKIALVDETSVTETRSTPQELGKPTTDNFTLKIVNSASGKSIYDAGYTKDIIKASAGVYDVTASFGDNAVLAYDAPYYEGKKEDIAIEEGDTASVTVECAVANALASVTFEDSEKFKELYSSYAVEVAVENSSLKLGDGDKRSAYYRADSRPTFTFKGVLKANGKSVEAELEDEKLSDPATFAAKAHCQLTLALKEMVPGIIPTIVKAEVDTVTVSATLPMEWLPAPKVSATGFGENRTLDVYETAPTEASIDFTLSSPLQDMEFSVNFADENLKSLNGDYALSALTNEQRLDFVNAGIALPIMGEEKPSVKFSNTLTGALLATNEGVVNNTFTLKSVKANNRTNKDGALTYTIATHKPEFTVSVLPGNIWTKEFTVEEITVEEGKGDLNTLKEKLVYQYSDDEGSSWKDLNDTRRQFFDVCPETKSYLVRAVYRNEIVSEINNVELEIPTQLPNSGMEDWYIETKTKSGTWPFKDKTYYTYHPYTEGAGDSSWWDTNNDKAQGGTYALGIWYEGCFASCVSYTEDAHEGSKAALMYVSGCGDGYANTPDTYVGGAMVGSLFIGSYNSGIVQGHGFASRPTSLSFWYKYKPYNTDAFKVVIFLKNGEKEIATGTYEPQAYSEEDNGYIQATVDFNYSDEMEKPTTICVQFLASNKTSLSSDDFEKGTTITYPVVGNWTVHMGSVLKIDDISLVYDK